MKNITSARKTTTKAKVTTTVNAITRNTKAQNITTTANATKSKNTKTQNDTTQNDTAIKNITIEGLYDILQQFFTQDSPLDVIIYKYFKNKKYYGSSDRRAIADFAFAIFREYELLKYYFSNSNQALQKFITDNVDFKISCVAKFFIAAKIIHDFDCDLENTENLKNQNLEKVDSENQNLKNLKNVINCFSKSKREDIHINAFEKKIIEKMLKRKDFCKNSLNKSTLNNQEYSSIILNYPYFLSQHFQGAFKNNFENEMLALKQKASVDIRINTMKTNVNSVFSQLKNDGIQNIKIAKYAKQCIKIYDQKINNSYPLIQNGHIEIQDEGSQMIAKMCESNSMHTVIDFCAGAGGKTLALADVMGNKGVIFALDVDYVRLQNAKERLKRANIFNAQCLQIDGKWLKRHKNCADIVLLDVPCSGSGTWRRNPDMRFRIKEDFLPSLLQTQYDILNTAKDLVKVGGIFVYATCSVFCQENEEQICKFLDENKDFSIDEEFFDGDIFAQELKCTLFENRFLKLSAFKNETDGFFCARMKRVG